MSDYLSRLVAKTLRSEAVLRPRILSRFEPLNPFNRSQPLEWQPRDEVEVVQQEHATAPPEASKTRRETDNLPSERPRQIEREPYRGKYVSPTLHQPDKPLLQRDQESHQVNRNEDQRSVSQEAPLLASETAKIPDKMVKVPDKMAKIPDNYALEDQTVQPHSVQSLAHASAGVRPAITAAELRPTKPWSKKDPFVGTETARVMTKRSESTSVTRGQQAAPTVKVHIGRIEVRAVMPAAPSPPRPSGARPKAALSLEDYLKQRREGRR
jgi:hypothetical protein